MSSALDHQTAAPTRVRRLQSPLPSEAFIHHRGIQALLAALPASADAAVLLIDLGGAGVVIDGRCLRRWVQERGSCSVPLPTMVGQATEELGTLMLP